MCQLHRSEHAMLDLHFNAPSSIDLRHTANRHTAVWACRVKVHCSEHVMLRLHLMQLLVQVCSAQQKPGGEGPSASHSWCMSCNCAVAACLIVTNVGHPRLEHAMCGFEAILGRLDTHIQASQGPDVMLLL